MMKGVLKMALLKSKAEKKWMAVQKAVKTCTEEAKIRFRQIVFAYQKDRTDMADMDAYITAFSEIYELIYRQKPIDYGDGLPLKHVLREDLIYSYFSRACEYYIFLNLMIPLILEEKIKHITKEDLEFLEKYSLVIKRIVDSFPQKSMFEKEVDIYFFGEFKSTQSAYIPSVRGLFKRELKLVRGGF
jgi:hypothetical protein